jgi:hypothetical protein
MKHSSKDVRSIQPRGTRLGRPQFLAHELVARVVIVLLMVPAFVRPNIATYAALAIGMLITIIAAFWDAWCAAVDKRAPSDTCRHCQQGLIGRIATSASGERFYQCDACGAFYRRWSRADPYVDASALDFGAVAAKTRSSACGKAAANPREDSFDWTRTVTMLCQNKRQRQLTHAGTRRGTKVNSSGQPRRLPVTHPSRYRDPLWDLQLDGGSVGASATGES